MMGLTLKGQESMWYAFSWIQALFPPLEEKDEVVPLERSLPVLSTPIHLFEAALFTQLSGWHPFLNVATQLGWKAAGTEPNKRIYSFFKKETPHIKLYNSFF